MLDLSRAYELSPQVAVRPERFGALVYHYGTRRLSFLKSPSLARLVTELADHPDAGSALDACVAPESRRAHVVALTDLAASGVIRER